MTEIVDVAGVLAYNTNLDVMDFRCSNSVAALAVLMGSGACALFAPAAWAGDRIDFSAPAIPLSVPRPEVEVKEPAKMIGSGVAADDIIGNVEMASPSQYVLIKPKHNDKDDWNLDARLDGDANQRDGDDLFTGRPDTTRETNSNNLNAKQGLNPNAPGNLLQQRYDSGLDGSQDESRFAAWNGMDKDDARSGDRFGRGFSSANDDSFLTKAFSRDASRIDRFNDVRSIPSMSDARTLSGGAFKERMNDPGVGQDSARTAAAPPDYMGFTALDVGQSRQFGEPGGEGRASFRAWAPAASPVLPARSFSNPDQVNYSRVVAPNRPAILAMPSRPGDPH